MSARRGTGLGVLVAAAALGASQFSGVVPAAAQAAPSAVWQCDPATTISFSPASADHRWSVAANWADDTGAARLPARDDLVCLGFGEVELDQVVHVRGLQLTDAGALVAPPRASGSHRLEADRIDNRGLVDLSDTVLIGAMASAGELVLRSSGWYPGDATAAPRLRNEGQVLVEGASAVFGEVDNFGTMHETGTAPATLTVWGGTLRGDPPSGTRVRLESGGRLGPLAARRSVVLPGLAMGQGTRVAVPLLGASLGGSRWFDVRGTFESTYDAGAFAVDARVSACTGDRFLLARWTGRYLPPGLVATPGLDVTGMAAGRTLRLVDRGDQLVAIADGVPGPGGPACANTEAERFASGLYLDATGVPADAAGLAFWSARVAQPRDREVMARHLLSGEVARRRLIDAEYRRILGRPADPQGLAHWSARLAAGDPPDRLREELYGSAGFTARVGSEPGDFARGLARTELGIEPGYAFIQTVTLRLGRGVTRAQVARWMLRGAEADAALVAREARYWWDRPIGAGESAPHVAELQAGRAELVVRARIAAARPTG